MEIRRINDDIAVAPQIMAEHVPDIAKAGFKSIVCNRPDTEDGAVPHDRVQEAAKAAGLEFRFIPVVSGAITDDNVRDMATALKALPCGVLAYCRTGGQAAHAYFVLRYLGENPLIYDGSYIQWQSRDDLPVVCGQFTIRF